jgi:ABC-type Fe3+ transport system substrate-binding protein
MIRHILYPCVLIIGILSGCFYQVAKPNKRQYLVIASDCLEYKDTVLFDAFEKRTKIQVILRPMSTTEMSKMIQREGAQTKFDMCILSSSYDAEEMRINGCFQSNASDVMQDTPTEFSAFIDNKLSLFGIGIDPYVFSYTTDSLHNVQGYDDLSKQIPWFSDRTEKRDWYPFCASVLLRAKKDKTFRAVAWLDRLILNRKKTVSRDSTHSGSIMLSRYSYLDGQDSGKKSMIPIPKIIFPAQQSTGSYYDYVVTAIVSQARNYTNALKLLRYLHSRGGNQRICRHLHCFSLYELQKRTLKTKTGDFRMFVVSLADLISTYDDVKISLQEVSKKQKRREREKRKKIIRPVSDSLSVSNTE